MAELNDDAVILEGYFKWRTEREYGKFLLTPEAYLLDKSKEEAFDRVITAAEFLYQIRNEAGDFPTDQIDFLLDILEGNV